MEFFFFFFSGILTIDYCFFFFIFFLYKSFDSQLYYSPFLFPSSLILSPAFPSWYIYIFYPRNDEKGKNKNPFSLFFSKKDFWNKVKCPMPNFSFCEQIYCNLDNWDIRHLVLRAELSVPHVLKRGTRCGVCRSDRGLFRTRSYPPKGVL